MATKADFARWEKQAQKLRDDCASEKADRLSQAEAAAEFYAGPVFESMVDKADRDFDARQVEL